MHLLLFVGFIYCCFVNGQFSLGLTPNTSICKTKSEIAAVVAKAIVDNELIVVYASRELSKDGYAALYAGWIQELFTSDQFKTRMLFLDTSPDKFTTITDFLFDILPKESIFSSFDHGLYTRRITELGNLKNIARFTNYSGEIMQTYRKIADFGIFHFNHEQPWNFDSNYFHHDYTSLDQLLSVYKQHELIFRNYYYDPFEIFSAPSSSSSVSNTNVIQLPVGPSFYNYWFNNPLSQLITTKKVSERIIKCRFIGRKDYVMLGKYSIPERDALFTIANYDNHSSTHNNIHRYGFSSTITNNDNTDAADAVPVFPCEVFDYVINQKYNYEAYLITLVDTKYIPCPPGNNPETFRHYEVSE